jgi:hypothetical protein
MNFIAEILISGYNGQRMVKLKTLFLCQVVPNLLK